MGYKVALAWRYFKGIKGQKSFASFMSIFSCISIALGVATLLIVMGVLNGFRFHLLDKMLHFNAHVVFVNHKGFLPIQKGQQVCAEIRANSAVKNCLPMFEGQAVALSESLSSGLKVRAYSAPDLAQKKVLKKLFEQSPSLLQYAKNPIIIGRQLAQRLSLNLGDHLKLLQPQGHTTPFGRLPKQSSFQVVAILG